MSASCSLISFRITSFLNSQFKTRSGTYPYCVRVAYLSQRMLYVNAENLSFWAAEDLVSSRMIQSRSGGGSCSVQMLVISVTQNCDFQKGTLSVKSYLACFLEDILSAALSRLALACSSNLRRGDSHGCLGPQD